MWCETSDGERGFRLDSRGIVVIEPRRGLGTLRIRETWEARGLLGILVWRDITIRYKQTVLGVLWAFLQPALTALVFTLLFGRLAGIASDGVPYTLFSYTGLVLWTFFSQGVALSSNSLVNSAHIITKVYFPRVFLPAAAIFAGLVDLVLASSLILVIAAVVDFPLKLNLLLGVSSVLLALVVAMSVSLWLSSLNVLYRDVRFIVPFLIQIWLFLTPVIYPASVVAPRLEAMGLPEWAIALNPMVGAIEGFRSAILGGEAEASGYLLIGWGVAFFLLVTGLLFFRRTEARFADVV